MKRTRVYISGMITALKEDQYRMAFNKATIFLGEAGYEPVDPSLLGKPEHNSWDYYMRKAIAQLVECDEIYMIDGWRNSKGARLEWHIAKNLGMPIMEEGIEENLDKGNYGQEQY